MSDGTKVSSAASEGTGIYGHDGCTMDDPVQDLYSFILPIQATFIARLQANN
jgi:hypothetical protein